MPRGALGFFGQRATKRVATEPAEKAAGAEKPPAAQKRGAGSKVASKQEVGETVSGAVAELSKYGVVVDVADAEEALLPDSQDERRARWARKLDVDASSEPERVITQPRADGGKEPERAKEDSGCSSGEQEDYTYFQKPQAPESPKKPQMPEKPEKQGLQPSRPRASAARGFFMRGRGLAPKTEPPPREQQKPPPREQQPPKRQRSQRPERPQRRTTSQPPPPPPPPPGEPGREAAWPEAQTREEKAAEAGRGKWGKGQQSGPRAQGRDSAPEFQEDPGSARPRRGKSLPRPSDDRVSRSAVPGPPPRKPEVDEGYDRDAVKLRTPIEVTLAKGAGKDGRLAKGHRGLWTGFEQPARSQGAAVLDAKGGPGKGAKGKGGAQAKGQKGLWTGFEPSQRPSQSQAPPARPQTPVARDYGDPLSRGSGVTRSRQRWRPLSSIRENEVVQGKVTCFVEEGVRVDFGCLVEALLPNSQIDFPVFPGDLLLNLVVDQVDVKDDRIVLRCEDDAGWEEAYCSDGYCGEEEEAEEPECETVAPAAKSQERLPVDPSRDLFPEPDEVPRLTRSEMRGGPTAPRPNRFNRRQPQTGEADAGGDQEDELVTSLLPELLQEEPTQGETAVPRREQESGEAPELEDAEPGGVPEEVHEPAKPDPSTTALHSPAVKGLLRQLAAGQGEAVEDCGKVVVSAERPVQACAAVSAALKVMLRNASTALAALKGMISLHEEVGRASEPFLVRNLPVVLEQFGSRQREVQVAAEDMAETLIARLNPYGVETALPAVLAGLKQKEKTEVKVGALRLLALMRDEDTIKPLALQLDRVMPHIAEMLNDVKREVRQTAADAAKVLFECAQNRDLDPYLDGIIKAMMDQEVIPRVVSQLSEIVFVQSVETPALAIVMPLIVRGLKDRDERTKRRALVVADNMCKLVPDVTEIQPFLPTLIPLVEKATHNISDPEVRSVASRCYATLQTADKADRRRFISKTAVLNFLQEKIPEEKTQLVSDVIADYVASLCACISACRSFEYAEWWQCIAPYLSPSILSVEDCEDLVPDLLESCYDAAEGDDVEDLDEEGEDLCNCIFTLGYGALTLLNNTRLHLKRGKCYGLCGPNDCGKSTLLRAINNEQVDGFPPKSELVTAFVEHGIGEKEPECEWTPLEYIFADETIQAMGATKKKVVAALRSIGFDDQKLKSEIGHLSGGWKMKLGLVRAMLMCADILLLDEPTGHLDVANVAWLGEYVLSLSKDKSRPVTTIVVSHDTSFLDRVCTHVINVKQRKLKTYKGNISDFVRRCPEAKSYLSLTSDKSRFVLPEPGMLEGVKSKGKKLLKMQNVTYTYPGNQTPTLFNVSIEVSLLSRVAVIGPNGAGKSTMIKALVGELPVSGKSIVWKHPNVRISYVAQHAFHHVEEHLDKTPTQYLLWRFAGGEDREALNYRSEEVSGPKKKYWLNEAGVLCRCMKPEEEAKAVEPELILGRKKSRSKAGVGDEKYEYSVKWHTVGTESVMWVPREILLEMGHLRLVQREDEKQAAAHGLVSRPLTQPQVEEHLAGFGLHSDFASHTRLGILSGGQKVKVVLGAAMWLSPHLLILDEPTNYLDRDSLGALAAGLKEFGGGVIVISHNREFCHAVCDERWLMDAGRLTREGQSSKADVALEGRTVADEYTDEFGNVHKIKKQNHTDKELKKIKRQRELARKRGDVFIEDEDEWWDKLQEEVSKPAASQSADASKETADREAGSTAEP